MKQRLVATLALGLAVAGCGLAPERLPLITGVPAAEGGTDGRSGCFLWHLDGRLDFDPQVGTEVLGGPSGPIPVAWRPGFSARRAGSEVEVVDATGNVVAVTGRSYSIDGGYVTDWPQGPGAGSTFWACDEVRPLS